MSGDDLRVTTAHLVELSDRHVRAATDIRSATFAVDGAAAAVRSTHGLIASATADAVSDAVAARRCSGTKMAAVSDELGGNVAQAARRYDHIDDASGRTLDGQVRPV